MERMTYEECKQFLLEKPRPAIAAIVRADGSPHATPVWIDMDGDQVIFETSRESLKGRALRRYPRISLCVDDDQPPFSAVTIEGSAIISDDLADVRYWAGRIGGRYMGKDQAEAYAERNGVEGELVVRVTILNASGFRNVAE
ncbi:MAG: PPOX class F420-dependent oxidoreductase [Chloroflexota bacterium]|nr:PPOX class F420-dependent oxidoreductase [Chloroflexota bacterium]